MLFLLSIAAAVSGPPGDVLGRAWGAALQANERRTLELLKGVDLTALSNKDRHFVTCVRARFSSPKPLPIHGKAFPDRALSIYQSYWHSALLHTEGRAAAELGLETALGRLLHAKHGTRIDALEPMLAKRLEASGRHSLEGKTGLLRDLMIWGKQDEKMVAVALPEGQYQAKVFYLNNFNNFGWSDYATCGRAATAGWATDSALFAVVPRYESIDNEEFRVSFLGHETQHFADKARFKDLKSWELEYRAKLVEISLADTTRAKVVAKFVSDQSDNPADPHSYADRKLISELVKRLRLESEKDLYTVDLSRLQSAARDTLMDDSQERLAAGQLEQSNQRQGR